MRHQGPARPSSRTGRARRAVLAGVVAVLASSLAPAGWAQSADPTDPAEVKARERAAEILADTLELAPKAPPSPDDPFLVVIEAGKAVDEAALARLDAFQRSEAANVEAYNAAIARNAAQTVTDAAVQARDLARTKLAVERKRLSDLTVRAYVNGGTVAIDEYRAYIDGDTTDPAAGQQLLFNQVLTRQEQVTEQARHVLSVARRTLTAARHRLDEATAYAEDRSANAVRLGQDRDQAAQRHEEAVADAARARDRLRAAGRRGFALVPQEVALVGLPRLTAEDLAGWFRTTAYRPRVATPIEDYARWFIEEGAAEGIRGDIAFAQAVLETGGFANEDSVSANNFSGIGHCDLCPSGWSFPSPRMGVRAQIQLLKSYAIRKPDYVFPLVDRRLRGPAGCCPTWNGLTTVWATDPTYGSKVMLIYSDLVTYALARRAAGQGFDDPPPAFPEP